MDNNIFVGCRRGEKKTEAHFLQHAASTILGEEVVAVNGLTHKLKGDLRVKDSDKSKAKFQLLFTNTMDLEVYSKILGEMLKVHGSTSLQNIKACKRSVN